MENKEDHKSASASDNREEEQNNTNPSSDNQRCISNSILQRNSELLSNVEQLLASNLKPCVASESPSSFAVNLSLQFPTAQFNPVGHQGPWDYSLKQVSNSVALQSQTASSAPPPGRPSQMDVIGSLVQISRNFQQLWDAQLPRNNQQRTEIDRLQSDIADQKLYIMKLEGEIASLKQPTKVSIDHVTETAVSGQGLHFPGTSGDIALQPPTALSVPSPGQPSEMSVIRRQVHGRRTGSLVSGLASNISVRGRPKTKIPPSPDALGTAVGGKMKKQKSGGFEKAAKPSNQTAISLQEEKNVSNVMTNNSVDKSMNRSNDMMILSWNQVQPEISQMQMSSAGLDSSLENSFGFGKYASSAGIRGFGNVGGLQQGGKIIPGWGSVNELDNAVATSTKDESEEEKKDDGSSANEEKR